MKRIALAAALAALPLAAMAAGLPTEFYGDWCRVDTDDSFVRGKCGTDKRLSISNKLITYHMTGTVCVITEIVDKQENAYRVGASCKSDMADNKEEWAPSQHEWWKIARGRLRIGSLLRYVR